MLKNVTYVAMDVGILKEDAEHAKMLAKYATFVSVWISFLSLSPKTENRYIQLYQIATVIKRISYHGHKL